MAWLRTTTQKTAVLTGLLAGMVFCFGASVSLGTYSIALHEVVQAFIHFDPGLTEHILVIHTRLPRAVTAMLVGGGSFCHLCIRSGIGRERWTYAC